MTRNVCLSFCLRWFEDKNGIGFYSQAMRKCESNLEFKIPEKKKIA